MVEMIGGSIVDEMEKTIILNRYLSDCPYIRLVLFNEKISILC